MFNLRRYFSLTSAAVIIVGTVVLAISYRQYAMNELVEIAERQNVTLARSFANFLWPRFSSYVMSVSERDGDTLRARPETSEIHEVLEKLTADIPVLKVKIYKLDGLTVYSSEPSQIGADKSNNPRFLRAGRGAAVSQLSHRETFSAFSAIVEDRDLVESYVPIRGRNGRVEGVFELYADVTPLVVRIEDGTTKLVVILLLSFGSMYGCLFLIVRRADLILKKQYIELENEVAERKRAEAELRVARDEMEDQVTDRTTELGAVLDNSLVSIITIDAEGAIMSFNPAAERLFGYTAEEAISRNVSMLIPEPHHEAHDGYIANYRTGDRTGVVGRMRMVVGHHMDGHTIPLELSLGEMTVHGEIHFVGFLTDITERVAGEEELRQAQKMEAIGRLTGGVAHEFNNLLTAIGGFAHLVTRWADNPEKVRDWSKDIVDAADQAASLTRQLLAFSRKQILEPQVVSIGQVLKNTETLTRPIMGGEISTHYKLTFDVGDENIHVKVDPGQLSQALLNLSINGHDAMPEGGTLTIASRVMDLDRAAVAGFEQAEPGRYVAISVTDTGTGIDEDTMEKIFEPFFTTKEEGEGTGLGLAMVYGMVQQSGGVITVDSEVGRGTTFTIYLPFVGEPPLAAEANAEAGALPHGSETVLLAEEEIAVRQLARITLEGLGYTVLTANDGMKAVEIFRDHEGPIDLLVTDLKMPQLNGRTLARMLTAENPSLRVLYITGYDDPKQKTRCGPADDAVVLTKPFDPDELAQLVRGVLDATDRPSAA